MEQAESQGTVAPTRIRATWMQLTLECSALVAAALLLVRIGLQIPDARPDLGFLFAVGVFLHATGVLRFARRAADFMDLECPRCTQSFHGVPDRLPRPYRTRCAHCGAHA